MSPHSITVRRSLNVPFSEVSFHPLAEGQEPLVWRTAEAFFQASRFEPGDPIREEIRSQTSPMAAKMVAKRERDKMVVEPQSDADLFLMRLTLMLKLEQHPQLKEELIATGDALIIEDCTNRPHGSGLFWGAAKQADGTWLGENTLGKLWMDRRAALTPPASTSSETP